MGVETLRYNLMEAVAVLAVLAVFLGMLLVRNAWKRGKEVERGNGTIGDASKTGKEGLRRLGGTLTSSVFGGLLVLGIGVGALLWSTSASAPAFSQVGSWSSDHWLQILIAWATLAALVWMNKENLGSAAGTLQKIFALAAFVVFIVLPSAGWVSGVYASWEKEHPVPQVSCQDVSAFQRRGCMVNEKWSSGVKIADGPESNGMQLCYTPGVDIRRVDRNGTTFWFFKAPEGTVVKVEYRLLPPDVPCPATLPS